MKKWIQLADIRYGHKHRKNEVNTTMSGLGKKMFGNIAANIKDNTVAYEADLRVNDEYFEDKEDGEMNTSRPMIDTGDL
jgi:hypothetical protein